MDADGIQKVWNTNARTRTASSTATRSVTAVCVSVRIRRRRRRADASRAGVSRAGVSRAGHAAPPRMVTWARPVAGAGPGRRAGPERVRASQAWHCGCPRGWLVLAALAGPAEASSAAETPSRQAAASSARPPCSAAGWGAA